MTRDDILKQAGLLLKDTSVNFLTEFLNPTFDLVLAEMAQKGAISLLTSRRSGVVFVLNQRAYPTPALCGLTAPDQPFEVISLRAWTMGLPGGVIEKISDSAYSFRRARDLDVAGKPRWWHYAPNEGTIEVHPVPDATSAAASVDVLFLKSPTRISGATEITEVHYEDLSVIVAGLQMYGVEQWDDSVTDRDSQRQKTLAVWGAGLQTMVARTKLRSLTDRQRMYDAGGKTR